MGGQWSENFTRETTDHETETVTRLSSHQKLSASKLAHLDSHCRELHLIMPGGAQMSEVATICLPTQLFLQPSASLEHDWSHDPKTNMSWSRVLGGYRYPQYVEDPRLTRMSVHEAPWFDGLGGIYLVLIPVSDIWRLLASSQSSRRPLPGRNPYGIGIFFLGKHGSLPLIRIDT